MYAHQLARPLLAKARWKLLAVVGEHSAGPQPRLGRAPAQLLAQQHCSLLPPTHTNAFPQRC